MPDEPIDGSNLADENIQQAEAVAEQVQTEPVPPAETQQPQPPQANIPEQYRGKTPEELVHELQKRDSLLGKYRAEVGTLRQVREAARYQPPQPVYNQPIPSSLPGYEVPGQRTGQQPNLNELYFERPADVLEQIVEKKVNAGIQTYEAQQTLRQQQNAASRAQWISSVDDDELQNLKLEENFTPEHEAVMEALAKRDPEVLNLLRDPNITEQGIRETVRKLYAKADKILSGQLQDPEKIRALNIAQKEAAAQGAPHPRAGLTGQPSSELPEQLSNYRFLLEG